MYDVIVIGLGSMGSSALYHLAKAGMKVLGVEQFGIVHDLGSHSGTTRIVRKAYFEHTDYVPLLKSSYRGWDEIQKESEEELFIQTGLAYFGNPSHPVMEGVKESSKLYDITLLKREKRDYKNFSLPPEFEVLIEPEAGFALTDKTINTLVDLANGLGAQVNTREKVLEIIQKPDFLALKTNKEQYKTQKVVITSGAYINNLINLPNAEMNITRQLICWVEPKNRETFELEKFPSWMIADDDFSGVFYGFPIVTPNKHVGNNLLKVAHHSVGNQIDPKNLHWFDSEKEKAKIIKVLKKYLPDSLGEVKSVSACMYTNSPDDDFIIDFLPDSNQRIVLATGFSGHGFKFVPVVGEILRDLVLDGKTDEPIEFLSLDRFK